MASTGYLSKSLFIRGRQCHKSLWLHRNCPELRDPTAPALEKIFCQGTEVGILAQQLFPGGVEVPYDGLTYEEQTERTTALIRDGISTIYEATFRENGIFIKVDILHHGHYGWEIYEVKSSTQVKPVFIFDAALQYHVVAAAGLPVSRVSIITLNNGYTRYGALNLERLFSSHDITDKAEELQTVVLEELERQREVLQGDLPVIGIGHHCDKPYSCDFKGHCWQDIPEDSVFDIAGRGIDLFAFYHQGIIRQSDIPLDRLNRRQRLQVKGTLQQKDSINKPAIWKFCSALFYPLCFLDFETFMVAVPTSDDCRPYQQIPFQFSLHLTAARCGN